MLNSYQQASSPARSSHADVKDYKKAAEAVCLAS
jgi:hypothetical protein